MRGKRRHIVRVDPNSVMQRGGFHGQESPEALAARYTEHRKGIIEEVARDEFHIPEKELHAFLEAMDHQLRSFTIIMDRLGNSERNQVKALEEIKDEYKKIRAEFRYLANPNIVQAIERVPEFREKLKGQEAQIAMVEQQMTRIANISLGSTAGCVDPIIVRSEIEFLLRPENRDGLRAHEFDSITKWLNIVGAYREEAVVADFDRFIAKFSECAEHFSALARKERGGLPAAQLNCFKSMCYVMIAKNVGHRFSLYERDRTADTTRLAVWAFECPYMLILGDATVEKLFEIAKSVKSERVAKEITENPQWINPKDNFAALVSLLDELKTSSRSFALFEVIRTRSSRTAAKLVRKLKARPQFEELASLVDRPEKGIARNTNFKSTRLASYILDIADEVVGTNGKTFQDILEAFLAGRRPDERQNVAGNVIRYSEDIYLSGVWEELATLGNGTGEDRKISNEAVRRIKKGELEEAREVIREHKVAIEEEQTADLVERLRKRFDDASPMQIDHFRTICARLESLGIESRAFLTLRKRGLEIMDGVAVEASALDDPIIRAIFTSYENRNLFAKAVEFNGEHIADRLNEIARDYLPEDLERSVGFELQTHLDEVTEFKGRTFNRIVLIAGEETGSTLEERLGNETELEVKRIEGKEVSASYLRSIIREGDIVIIEGSHLGHAAAGNASAICRSNGILFLQGTQTNAAILAEKIRKAGERAKAERAA
ncbi:hypothetical protein HY988_02825 [Candidatus Micrarchaeota archaeon]|nr:hypothetical protein [Candidatus Micrarchaeota archaeon]